MNFMRNLPKPPVGYQLLQNNWLRRNTPPKGTRWSCVDSEEWTDLHEDLSGYTWEEIAVTESYFTDFIYCAPNGAVTQSTLLADLEALAAEWEAKAAELNAIDSYEARYVGSIAKCNASTLRNLIAKHTAP